MPSDYDLSGWLASASPDGRSLPICVSEPIVDGTILFHEVDLLEQPYEPLGRSLGLELSIAPLEKLLDVLPNGASQF